MNTSKQSLDDIFSEYGAVIIQAHSQYGFHADNMRERARKQAKAAIVEAVEGIYGDSDGLREFASTGSNQVGNLSELLEKFASIESPFDLFEPHLWYGKLGDEGWVCSIRSTHMTLWEGSGATPLEAAQACYKDAMSHDQGNDMVATDKEARNG